METEQSYSCDISVRVETLEKIKDIPFDLKKVAEFLGWQTLEKDDGSLEVTSRRRYPNLRLNQLGESLLVLECIAKSKYGSAAFFEKPDKFDYDHFNRIKDNQVIKEVRGVVIKSKNGDSLMLEDEHATSFTAGFKS